MLDQDSKCLVRNAVDDYYYGAGLRDAEAKEIVKAIIGRNPKSMCFRWKSGSDEFRWKILEI